MRRPHRHDARTPLRWLAALAAAFLLALALSACELPGTGGKEASDDATEKADVDDAMLEFAQCMRDNGVPMEDPKPGERGLVRQNAGDLDPEIVRAAEEECHGIIESAIPEDARREMPAEQKEALLAAAQCMREKGWDVPDPQFDGGKVTQRLEGGVDPEDPAFQKDQEACAEEAGLEMPRRERRS
ncbi:MULTISPECIES: hypothetical protein [Nocardioides]|uniref:Lipoprotein n=1 Tax=Nocardioides vastitatis TaxID=2568655 RepID=A0ABW0ZE30_9ACTN|nr:hypothetical protein [Nocardioides sp.]THI92513.1 hypothetical protein E7Z54_21880 [Nocardioides sp.]